MKIIIPGIAPALISVSLLFSLSNLNGQVAEDPITNIYKIGASSEIFIGYSTAGNTFTKQGVLDVPDNLNDITKTEDALQYKFMDIRKTATAVGDFNNDGYDDVVTIRDNISGGIKITIPLIGKDLTMSGETEYSLEELNTLPYERIRICTGNFDRDRQDEFAIVYGCPGETLRLLIFETDADLNISLIDAYKEIAYYDYNFDITAGDTDGDGIDEIVVVKNEALPTELSNAVNPPSFRSQYDLYIMKYDTLAGELVKLNEAQNIIIDNPQVAGGDWWHSIAINEMRVSCGDLNIDGKDEILVGWSNYYCYYRWKIYDDFLHITWHWGYKYSNALFLNTFRVLHPSGEIENVQNLYLGSNPFETRGVVAGQHIALSLKCEKLDNMGRDEVLINGSSYILVLGSTGEGMELEIKTMRTGTGGFLNIQGNEAFIVTDLNPDTAKLNFDKEVILLLSNQNAYYQMFKIADIPCFEILALDTISADTVAFLAPGPPHDLPTGDLDIEVSALAVGDFDLKNTVVYRVGTPDVIPVSDLQYPLVILNAPPVHFDVLDGVSHDLCDAYLDDENPAFSALYNTKVNEQNTTSVEVESSMGFSREFQTYAMVGGSGFEKSVTKSWEMGQSFYNAKSQSTQIEEEKEVYTEDFVLYSSLDYRYYRYPVYNDELKKIGTIAVLNPESDDFSSVWGSGNSWDHPGYIFNHEPGNILSYRPYKNTGDLCSNAVGFSSYEFSRVPVTNTGNGSFKFTFENITNEGSSFSFSAGTGSDMLTKVGFEGTATVNIGAFGIGGSISTDIKAGVSWELSSNFCQSQLCNHSTELSDAFQIDGKIGRLNESYDNIARYFITPYIYRSQSGALVLDYMVDLDESNMEWWDENYGQNTDLAFILPWRYAVEKGSEHLKVSKKQKTTEIQFYPSVVAPGDTVCITTRVHNYSLLTFDNTLKVKYYLGDPAHDGVELSDIYGTTGSSKHSTMIYNSAEPISDFEEYLTFNWKVPDTITCSPRIYAVIDEENEYTEIHEDNNTGWNKLSIKGCSECSYYDPYVNIEPVKEVAFNLETYPNPVSDYSRIHFSLPWSSNVRIDVFDLSGQKVSSLTDANYPPGEHDVEYYAGALSNGLYFYKFTAGSYTRTIKLMVMK